MRLGPIWNRRRLLEYGDWSWWYKRVHHRLSRKLQLQRRPIETYFTTCGHNFSCVMDSTLTSDVAGDGPSLQLMDLTGGDCPYPGWVDGSDGAGGHARTATQTPTRTTATRIPGTTTVSNTLAIPPGPSRRLRASPAALLSLLLPLYLCAPNAICQGSDFWGAQPKYSLDLHPHGYRDSDGDGPRRDGAELAFVSDSAIVGAIAQGSGSWALPPTNVFAFDMSHNAVRDVPETPVGPFLFCPLSGKRVALPSPAGIRVCDARLVCGISVRPGGAIASSPFGTRLAIRRRTRDPQFIVDTTTWKQVTSVSFARPLDRVIPGDEHFLIRRDLSANLQKDDGRYLILAGLGTIADAQFLDATRIAATGWQLSAVAVFDVEGKQQHLVKTDPASRVSILRAPAGGRFAVEELGYTSRSRVFSFLDRENGRRRDLLKVRIFETANGKQIAEFESDPAGGSGFALSPNGHLLASEKAGNLRVVAIP